MYFGVPASRLTTRTDYVITMEESGLDLPLRRLDEVRGEAAVGGRWEVTESSRPDPDFRLLELDSSESSSSQLTRPRSCNQKRRGMGLLVEYLYSWLKLCSSAHWLRLRIQPIGEQDFRRRWSRSNLMSWRALPFLLWKYPRRKAESPNTAKIQRMLPHGTN
jgi:hypothetical protein